jgi:hypothetical protein
MHRRILYFKVVIYAMMGIVTLQFILAMVVSRFCPLKSAIFDDFDNRQRFSLVGLLLLLGIQ